MMMVSYHASNLVGSHFSATALAAIKSELKTVSVKDLDLGHAFLTQI